MNPTRLALRPSSARKMGTKVLNMGQMTAIPKRPVPTKRDLESKARFIYCLINHWIRSYETR